MLYKQFQNILTKRKRIQEKNKITLIYVRDFSSFKDTLESKKD